VLIPNSDYKGKGHTESALSNPTLRVLPKITASEEMEFTNNDMEDEKEELSNELVASLKQKITTSEELVAELHLVVYNQHDNFGVLRKASTSKLKLFTKALGDLSLYNVHLHRVALEKFGNNKSIRIRSCLSSVIFPFSSRINKNGSLSLFFKIESWKQIFISHLVCF
jgi:hypothetical protein